MKSTLCSQLLLAAIQQGYNCCAYSGELPAYNFLDWICHQATKREYIGYKVSQQSGKTFTFVGEDAMERIKKYLDGRLYLYDNSCISDEDLSKSVIKMFEVCARRYGCKLFLADNLMCLTVSPEEENRAQAKVCAKLKAFANKYKVHVILAAHPRKGSKGETFDTQDISGSSAIGNLADSVLNVEKNPNLIRITKNRDFGIKGSIFTSYDPCTRRIFETEVGDKTILDWDYTGVKLPEHPAYTLPEFEIYNGANASTTIQPF